jgi:hypothetical protein
MTSAARQIPEQEVDIVTFFEPRFTALSNNLLEIIYTDPSVNPATRFLLFITRFSTGYLKPEVIMKESFILESTGMSRSSLYKAKNELIDSGKITVSYTKTGHCIYRIAAELQCLKGASAQPTAAEKAKERWTSATADLTRPQLETPMYKEKKKTAKTGRQQSARSADRFLAPNDDEISLSLSNAQSQPTIEPDLELEVQIASLEAEWKPEQNPVEPEVIKSSASGRPAAVTSEQGKLARQLHQTGIHWRIAVRLVRENDQQLIQNALARLKDRPNVKHPAGWLVEEIRAGGYNPPAPSPDTLIKQAHQTLADKRQTERRLAEIERDQANEKQLQHWAHFEKLPLDQRQSLIQQARQRLARLSPKMAQAPLDSVPLRAMILELAQAATLPTSLPMRE